MKLRFIHFYPDLMSLYGSYANLSVLQRYLERLGHTVEVESVRPGVHTELADADLLFMGAGTERSQKAALADFSPYAQEIKDAAEAGTAMLFVGTAMELLGRSITDHTGTLYEGIGLAPFTAVQGKRRYVGDVYGHTELYTEAVVGFMNKCSVISGVETPLLATLDMGFGNEGERSPEGFRWKNVFGSELTGPVLVKNPRLLDMLAGAVCAHRGVELPDKRPGDRWLEEGYRMTEEQLRLLAAKT